MTTVEAAPPPAPILLSGALLTLSAWLFGINAEGKSLEPVTKPLTAVADESTISR